MPVACVSEIHLPNKQKKYVSICSDSQAGLKALHAVRTSPFVPKVRKGNE